MEAIDLKLYLYHGVVDWLYYNIKESRRDFCLNKLESILKSRYISRPCDFDKFGVGHNDCMNEYTSNYTYVACHPNSCYASRFNKMIKEKYCFLIATEYSRFGIVLSPRLIDELPIEDEFFYDSEIVVPRNISLDQYGVGIYVNPALIVEGDLCRIKSMINQNGYLFPIINVQDGNVIEPIEKEKVKAITQSF